MGVDGVAEVPMGAEWGPGMGPLVCVVKCPEGLRWAAHPQHTPPRIAAGGTAYLIQIPDGGSKYDQSIVQRRGYSGGAVWRSSDQQLPAEWSQQ